MYVSKIKKMIDKHLEEVIKDYTIKFSTESRKVFLRHKVKIKIKEIGDKEIIAFYENTSEYEKEYTHIINITPMFITCCACWIDIKHSNYVHTQIVEALKHELIHAFVFEEFETLDIIKNMHSDYSPIFLSCLYWAGGSSSHSYVEKFRYSELADKVLACSNYTELKDLLLEYIFEYERSILRINKEIGPTRKLSIMFNFYGAGIKKAFYIKIKKLKKDRGKLNTSTYEQLILGIGFLVTPSSLLYDYKYKFNNKSIAENHKESVIYCLSSKKNREVEVFSNF